MKTFKRQDMVFDMELLELWIKVFTGLTAATGFIAVNWKLWLKKLWRRWYDHYKAGRQQRWIFIMNELREIKNEVKTNGGTSLKDVVLLNVGRLGKIDVKLDDLKEGQRNTREILNVANWESDSNGRIIYVSSSLCEIIGCSADDLLDQSWIGLVAAKDRERVYNSWKRSVDTASYFNEDFTFRKTDGMFQSVNATGIHNKTASGEVASSLVRINKVGESSKTI